MHKKLVYITNNPMPTGRAYGNQMVKLCEAFADSGINTELIYLGAENTDKREFFGHFGAKDNFILTPVSFFNFLRLERYIGRLSFYLQGLMFLARLSFLKIDKGAVIYTRHPEIAWLMGSRGFAVYYEDHGGINKNGYLFLKFLKRANGIVAINGFIKNEFVKKGIDPGKVLVVPSGVDLDNFDIDISREGAIERLGLEGDLGISLKNKKIMVYTGNFRTKGVSKGVEEILTAMGLLKDKDLVFLAVGGSAEEIDLYGRMAADSSINNAFFLPRQPQGKLALFQKAADVLLMPFPNKAHYGYFMSPVKMFEYMAAKRPVIASGLPSIKEVLNDKNALLVKEGDPEDLARGIKKILNDGQLAEDLAAQAFLDVQKYSWRERVRKILAFISQVS